MKNKNNPFKSYEKNLAAKSSPKVSFFVPFWIFGAPAASTNHLAIRGLMYDLTHGAMGTVELSTSKNFVQKTRDHEVMAKIYGETP